MSNMETTLNPNTQRPHLPEDDSVFTDPISADIPRRQFDRKLLESYDADHERIRAISRRQAGIEAILGSVQKDIRRLEELQSTMSGHLESASSSMSAISNKLSIHTEMEEYQWKIVNKANANIEALSAAFNDHVVASRCFATRVDWLERLMFGGCGVIVALLVSFFGAKLVGV